MGLGFLGAAISEFIFWGGTPRGAVFMVIAMLTGIPGGYMSFYIYKALKGAQGYHFSAIPSFDM